MINGKQIGATWRVPTPVGNTVQMVIGDFIGDVNLFGVNTNMPVNVLATGQAAPNVMVFGNYYRNQWNWADGGCAIVVKGDRCPITKMVSASSTWNENGPVTEMPVGALIVEALNWPAASPAQGSIVDCRQYQIKRKNVAAPSMVPFADWEPASSRSIMDPLWSQTPNSAIGIFKMGTDPRPASVRFSNNSIFNQAGPTACIDINPGNPIPAIEASLIEVRKAAAHVVARPCTTAVTDARLFRIQIGARFTHNALAVDRVLAPGSF